MEFYAVYDKKAMCFFPPFTTENNVQAIRGIDEAVNSSGSVLNRYPDDFALYYLGDFDNKKGKISQKEMNELVCECRQLVRPTMSYSASLNSEAPETASAVRAVSE